MAYSEDDIRTWIAKLIKKRRNFEKIKYEQEKDY